MSFLKRNLAALALLLLSLCAASGSAQATENLLNPGFESGEYAWVQSSTTGYNAFNNNASFAHGGGWYALLGYTDNASQSIIQTVTIPAGSSETWLQFWYRVSTFETTSSVVHDTMTVALLDTNNKVLTTLGVISNLYATAGWNQTGKLDLLPYAGKTVKLFFLASNDASNPTTFRVDDVSLTTSSTQAPGCSSAAACPVYRFANPYTGGHFFTAQESERSYVQSNLPSYHAEGVSYYTYSTQVASSLPVYRFSNSSGFHHFTISETEKNSILATDPNYQLNGVAFYAYPIQVAGSSPVYRFRNMYSGAFFYTISTSEANYVQANLPSYQYQGVSFYARTAP